MHGERGRRGKKRNGNTACILAARGVDVSYSLCSPVSSVHRAVCPCRSCPPVLTTPRLPARTSPLDTYSPPVEHNGHLSWLIHVASERSAGSVSQAAIAKSCSSESLRKGRQHHTHTKKGHSFEFCFLPLHQHHAPGTRPPLPAPPLCHKPDSKQESQRHFVLGFSWSLTHLSGVGESAESRAQAALGEGTRGAASPRTPREPWVTRAAPASLTRSFPSKDLLTAECHPCQIQRHTDSFWIHTGVGKPEMRDHRYMVEVGHLPGKVTRERTEGPQTYGWGHF